MDRNCFAILGRNIFGVEVNWFVLVVGFGVVEILIWGLDMNFVDWAEEGNILVASASPSLGPSAER
jgi:hypothetical protein